MNHYAILGGSTPYDKREMRKLIVDKFIGTDNYTEVDMFSAGYNELSEKFDRGELLYRSRSYQGTAYLSKDGNMIKASVFHNFSLIGVIYIKNK